ncbi:interferon, alpha-inducible protein 27 [Plakobranchus ocellatus]|uniref:Interferon, alpha-inducible protein 27 n=1 Tax=Plakobranchus ocellatus TaxID=259542 RepID=A0AAV4D0M6_9GAST|nr:interferon, alpha-inducible protein 27 [Plakobranchus ocellatus]
MAFRLVKIAVKVFMEASFKTKIGMLVGAGLGGVLTYFAGPPILVAMGFTSAGISAGSIGASMMSFASTFGIGGGVIASLQSAGAAGLGIGAFASGASVGSAAGGLIAKKVKTK